MGKERNGIIKNCFCCNKEFYVPKYREKKAKFCSTNCLNKGQYRLHSKICKGCNLEFKVSNSRLSKKYCNEDCKYIHVRSTKERRQASKLHSKIHRKDGKIKTIRRYLKKENKLICQICGFKDYDFCIDLHHIDENPENNHINNIAILCVICHRKLHKNIINLQGELKCH